MVLLLRGAESYEKILKLQILFRTNPMFKFTATPTPKHSKKFCLKYLNNYKKKLFKKKITNS